MRYNNTHYHLFRSLQLRIMLRYLCGRKVLFFFHIFTHGVFFSHAIQFSSFILKKLLHVSKYVGMSHSMIRYFDLSIASFDSYKQ